MMSKNKGIEKDDNDKDKQYQKREDMIFSFFRKLRKIEFEHTEHMQLF